MQIQKRKGTEGGLKRSKVRGEEQNRNGIWKKNKKEEDRVREGGNGEGKDCSPCTLGAETWKGRQPRG